jgi:hypothetical protein
VFLVIAFELLWIRTPFEVLAIEGEEFDGRLVEDNNLGTIDDYGGCGGVSSFYTATEVKMELD